MNGQDIKQIILTAIYCGTVITALVILYKADKNTKKDNNGDNAGNDKYTWHMINDENFLKKRKNDKAEKE